MDSRQQAAAGVLAVRGMLADWQAALAEAAAIEEAEHPPFTDRFGREWTWWKGDLWHHDDTLACSRDMIDRLVGLPPERLRANPNYWKLCDICRSRWADTSPVSPRVLLGESGWYDVRDGQYYSEPSINPRWALERAVGEARFPAPAKLIMLTLMTRLGPSSLDLGKWSPGTRRLAELTSLKRDTAIRYLALLETHGWLSKRTRKGRRTEYALSEGREFSDSGQERKPPSGPVKGTTISG